MNLLQLIQSGVIDHGPLLLAGFMGVVHCREWAGIPAKRKRFKALERLYRAGPMDLSAIGKAMSGRNSY